MFCEIDKNVFEHEHIKISVYKAIKSVGNINFILYKTVDSVPGGCAGVGTCTYL